MIAGKCSGALLHASGGLFRMWVREGANASGIEGQCRDAFRAGEQLGI